MELPSRVRVVVVLVNLSVYESGREPSQVHSKRKPHEEGRPNILIGTFDRREDGSSTDAIFDASPLINSSQYLCFVSRSNAPVAEKTVGWVYSQTARMSSSVQMDSLGGSWSLRKLMYFALCTCRVCHQHIGPSAMCELFPS